MDLWMAFADEKGEGTYRNLRSGPVLSVGEWQHVAFTFGKGEMKTFLNAVEVARLSVPLERYRADQTATTTIGRDGDLRPVPSGIRGFKGMIDEVRISDIDRERFDVPESLISATRERIDRHVTEAPDVTRGSRFGERRACEVYGSSQWRDPVIVRYDQHSLQRHLRCGSQARGVGGL